MTAPDTLTEALARLHAAALRFAHACVMAQAGLSADSRDPNRAEVDAADNELRIAACAFAEWAQ